MSITNFIAPLIKAKTLKNSKNFSQKDAISVYKYFSSNKYKIFNLLKFYTILHTILNQYF